MPKEFCNWDDLLAGKVGEPEAPQSAPLGYTGPILKKGEVPRKPSDQEIRRAILGNNPLRQPTDQELFGSMVVTQEQIEKAEKEWDNSLNKWFEDAKKPIDNKESDWASGKSFNETLTQEELIKRNMHLDDK